MQCSIGRTARCSVTTERGDVGVDGKEDPERGDMCMLLAASHCQMAETTQHCKAIMLQLKIKNILKSILTALVKK